MFAETMNNAYSSQACKHCKMFNVLVAYASLKISCFNSFWFSLFGLCFFRPSCVFYCLVVFF